MEDELIESPANQRDNKGRFLPGHDIGVKFQPGQSGNLNGRPVKEACLTSLLKEELERIPTLEQDGFDGNGKSNAYWIIKKALRDARSGDRWARQEAWERDEGKVTDKTEHKIEFTEPIKYINVVGPEDAIQK